LKKAKRKPTSKIRMTEVRNIDTKATRSHRNIPVFADERFMKQKARAVMMQRRHNVHDYYHTEGCMQKIAKHRLFENFSILVIALNSIWIGIDADLNNAASLFESELHFSLIENAFMIYFVLEILVRFLSFQHKRDCLRYAWFVFDSVLVFVTLLEGYALGFIVQQMNSVNLDIIRTARLAKLVRLARLARLLRSVPELVIVVKAIGAAARSIAVIGSFVLIVVYIFAVALKQLLRDYDSGAGNPKFNTVWTSMNSLLLNSILSDNVQIFLPLTEDHPALYPVIMTFVLVTGVMLMYMLIGVMVNVISMVAATEREGMAVQFLASTLRAVGKELMPDKIFDGPQPWSKEEFKELVVQPEVVRLLWDVEVDVYALIDVIDNTCEEILEREGRRVTFSDIVNTMLNMRGHNVATVKDVKSNLRAMKTVFSAELEQMNTTLSNDIRTIKQGIVNLQDDSSDEESVEEQGEVAILHS